MKLTWYFGNKKNFYINFFGIFILLLSSLMGCKSREDKSPFSVFRYNESSGIVNLDPAFARDQAHIWICNQLYNSLVQLDDSLNVKPAIAESWTISENGLIYTFNIRKDVLFHESKVFKTKNSRKLSAYDCEFSLKRLASTDLGSPGAWTLSKVKRNENNELKIVALNDSTLIIELEKPFPPFLGILSMQYCSIIPQIAVEYYGNSFGRNPVGSGPFFMRNWVEGVKLVLNKNADYFETKDGKQLPLLDGIAVSFIIDKMTAFLELVKGNIDFISGLDASYKDELLDLSGNLKPKYHDKIYVLSQPYLNTEYLGILVDDSMSRYNSLNNIYLRKAINFGFDRNKMMKYLRNNIGYAGNYGIIPPNMPGHGNFGYSFNSDSALNYIRKSGYFKLEEKPLIKLVTTAEYADLCKYVQSQLNDLGLEIDVEVSPAAALREMKANSKIDFFRASWIADYPDAENYLSLFYSENFAPNGPNYTHFKDEVFDNLYRETLRETNISKRLDLYSDMDSIIMQKAPVVILYYDKSMRFVRKNVKGMTSNPINLLNLKTVYKNK